MFIGAEFYSNGKIYSIALFLTKTKLYIKKYMYTEGRGHTCPKLKPIMLRR